MDEASKPKRNIQNLYGEWTVAELYVSYKPALKNKHSITSIDEAHTYSLTLE
jgi:hypothetical protein